MAIYHFSAKVISRSTGRSSVAAAAYRSASCLVDERQGVTHDFSSKSGVVHSELMLCKGASARFVDRSVLWNAVEAGEKRKDAQLSREVEFAIPREMSQAEGITLARDFVEREYVSRGMIADLNVHWDFDEAGQPKPHAHVMLTMRAVKGDGFGKKVREWNATSELTGGRERWEHHVNERAAELGYDLRIDHRSLAAQGSELEPQHKIGPAGQRRDARGEDAERTREHQDIARRNGDRILADPTIVLRSLTYQQSTFTRQDIARFVNRHTDGAEQFGAVITRVEASPDLVRLGTEWIGHDLAGEGRQAPSGGERFTTAEMIAVEAHLEQMADGLAARQPSGAAHDAAPGESSAASGVGPERDADGIGCGVGQERAFGHGVSAPSIEAALEAAEARGFEPGDEQADALRHVTGSSDLALVVGYAGTGKSAILGVARAAWEMEGYRVRGASLSGIAAEGLEAGSGIESRTIASLEWAWARDHDHLTENDILVVDEGGMVGSRQMDRVLTAVHEAGAKVVLVGDPQQLQAIEAGAAFRALQERHGAAEITEIRRQNVVWQRQATRELAGGGRGMGGDVGDIGHDRRAGGIALALKRYDDAGMVHAHGTRTEAKAALIDGWEAQRQAHPGDSQMMLAYTRVDVADLNSGARARLHEADALGEDHVVSTARGRRSFATGDRLMFLRNERSLDVKNGTLGTVVGIEAVGIAWGRDHAEGGNEDRVATSLAAERAEREGLLPYPAASAPSATAVPSMDRRSFDRSSSDPQSRDSQSWVSQSRGQRSLDQSLTDEQSLGGERGAMADGRLDTRQVADASVDDRAAAKPLHATRLVVQLDGQDSRTVAFDLKDYDHFDHGYAATIHKTQGVTVDRAHVLATPHMDRHATYVGLSRHREAVHLHYGQDDIRHGTRLAQVLSRDRSKDVTLDYRERFAELRDIRLEGGEHDDKGRTASLSGDSAAEQERQTAGVRMAEPERSDHAARETQEYEGRALETERLAIFFYAEAHGRLEQADEASHPMAPHVLRLERSHADLVATIGEDRAGDVAAAMNAAPQIGIDLVRARRLPIAERDAVRDGMLADLGERVQTLQMQRLARTAEHEVTPVPAFSIANATERAAVFDYARAFARLNQAQSAHHLTAPHEARLRKTEQGLEKTMGLVRALDVRVALRDHPDIASDLLQSRNLPVAERDAASDRFFSRLTSRGEEVAERRIEQTRQYQAERAREHERSLSHEYDLGISL